MWVFGLGPMVLGVHLVSVAVARARRAYSRSRLEEVCALRGHLRRADDVAHRDEATELSAEAMSVITGLVLAALLTALVPQVAPVGTGLLVVASVLIVTALGYMVAGAI